MLLRLIIAMTTFSASHHQVAKSSCTSSVELVGSIESWRFGGTSEAHAKMACNPLEHGRSIVNICNQIRLAFTVLSFFHFSWRCVHTRWIQHWSYFEYFGLFARAPMEHQVTRGQHEKDPRTFGIS